MADPIDEQSEPASRGASSSAHQDGASSVERAVRDFYDTYGWSKGGEDELYRQFRPPYWPYHEQTVARTLGCFAGRKGSLLFVGGGDLPRSHVALASNFASVACIDISEVALNITQKKLPQAERVLGSICSAPLASDTYDAVFCAHVIYHIDRNEQERAVREIIRVAKPVGRIVIIYNNPHSPLRFAAGAARQLRRRFAPSSPELKRSGGPAPLYFSPYPLSWWSRFKDTCSLTMLPWDIIGSGDEKTLIRTDGLARAFYRAASWAESHVPSACVYFWQYPIVILDKR
jgi:SAM-dependent methyltransferase